MKIIKADTMLKPVPQSHWTFDKDNDRVLVTPIMGRHGLPYGKKFNFKPRSYVFSVYAGEDTWTQVKFDINSLNNSNLPIKFDLPGELVLNPKVYSIFLGYNDGFLGGNFTPGYYSLKEKVQYWYTIAQTNSSYSIRDYFIYGDGNGVSSVVIDVSTMLTSPNLTSWRYYQYGDPMKYGDPIKYGEKYEQ